MNDHLVKRLAKDLNSHIRSRYGKPKDLIIEIIITQYSIKLLIRLLKYIIKKAENSSPPIEDINNIEEKKLKKHTTLQNLKTKLKAKLLIRGGDISTTLALLKQVTEIVETYGGTYAVMKVLLKLVRPTDLSPSLYDRYHRTFLIQSESSLACDDPTYAYLNKIFGDKKGNTISWQDKRDQIYNLLFKHGKLSSIKGKKRLIFMQLLFTCGILFTMKSDGETLFALMEAFKKALEEGTISPAVARRFIRRLQKVGVPTPPDIDELVVLAS